MTQRCMPQIVVSIANYNHARVDTIACFPPIFELRIDLFQQPFKACNVPDIINRLGGSKDTQTIATIRSRKEGGACALLDQKRLALFKEIIPHVTAVDVELSSQIILLDVIREAHQHKKQVIVSCHEFDTTLARMELDRILMRAKDAGADIVKIAMMANNYEDFLRLADFTSDNADKKIATISMGRIGALSRVLFPSLGSCLTYAHAGQSTAPGQMSYSELADLLNRFY